METILLTLILIVLIIIGRDEISEFFSDIFNYLAKPGSRAWLGIIFVLIMTLLAIIKAIKTL